ncbi:hypothetical protein GCM10009422_28080 [Brevundimonas kwangchunensis]|uniref:Glycosyl transferase family 1 n=1 Tax=Brevundimonas kwangchunensis TaxID=322163 RepID=A0ABP3SC87_9CAUL
MRVAVVMPAGCRMDAHRFNSMEAVATALNLESRFRAETVVICDEGAETPVAARMLTVPAGLGRSARLEAVADRLRQFAPDIVEYHQQLKESAKLARAVPGPINVLYRHTRIKPPRNPIERFRYRQRLAAFDHLLFVSKAACAEFRADYPRFDASVSAVCNPVDVKAWSAPVTERERLILFVGRALPEKGMDSFCEALATVLERRPDWRGALVLGEYERHEAWAAPHLQQLDRFGDRVEVHRSAPLSEVIAVTQRAAIAVTPSRVAEALGLTALEAHAAGAALVSSGRGGLREASGPNALFVDPPEASGLTEAIDRLVSDGSLRERMARAARKQVAATGTPAARAQQLDDLRLGLVSGHRWTEARSDRRTRFLTSSTKDIQWADARS